MVTSLNKRVEAFSSLGRAIDRAISGTGGHETVNLSTLIESCHLTNTWFTPEYVRQALSAWSQLLHKNKITEWLSRYPHKELTKSPSTILTIMAGNIPMVGFHDALSVLASGNRLLVKSSSKDPFLIKELLMILCSIEPSFRDMILFTTQNFRSADFDAVIATGSDNTARYFNYHFRKTPLLLRKNRTSVAILKGTESIEDIRALGEDVFSYFGLGCRSITQLWIPYDYNIEALTQEWQKYNEFMNHKQYANSYRYNKACMTINSDIFMDTGFLLLKHGNSLFSPVAVINYEFINGDSIDRHIEELADKIQVISGEDHTPFGEAQKPKLWDYSDNIDTISFILKL